MKITSQIILFVIAAVGVLPIVWMFFDSFVIKDHFAFDNYLLFLKDSHNFVLLLNSFAIGLLAVVVSLLIGIPISFLLAKTNIPFKNIFTTVFLLPIFIPPYIYAVAWKSILRRNGIIDKLFSQSEVIPAFINSIVGCAFILALAFLPITILFLTNALKNVDQAIEEAAQLEAGKLKVFLHITLPLIRPAILSSSILIFVLAISEFAVPMFLGASVFTTEIFTQFSAFYNYGYAVALSIPLILITLLIMFFEYRQLRFISFSNIDNNFQRSKPISLAGKKIPAVLFLTAIIFFLVFLPVGIIFYNSFPLTSYAKAFNAAEDGIIISLFNSFVGALLITAFGFICAFLVVRKKKNIFDLIPMLVFAVPSVILGIGLIQLWNRGIFANIIYNTFVIVQIGYLAKFLSVSTRLFSNSLKQIPESIEEAALIDGANQFQIFRKIVLPLLTPTVLISIIISLIFCFGELALTIIIYPAGGATLPIRLFTIMANSPENVSSAMSIILLIPITIAVFLLFSISKTFAKKIGEI